MSAMHLSTRSHFIKGLLIVLIAAAFGPEASAQSKKPTKSAKASATAPKSGKSTPGSGKLDISDLEQKYWSPKDTDFGVVQNRAYPKEKRFSASLLYGPVVNDVFNSGSAIGLVGNYFFSERHGIELFMINSSLSNSDATNDFKNLSGGGTIPDFGRVKQYYGIAYNFVPIYAKMSLLGRKIIYFDMAITPGMGFTTYEKVVDPTAPIQPSDGTAFTYSLDITQYFFFSRNFAIRADVRNRWFQEEVVGYKTGTKVRNKTSSRMFFLMGLTYFF